MQQLDLPLGYYELPKGRLANVVTCLEMKVNPQVKDLVLLFLFQRHTKEHNTK